MFTDMLLKQGHKLRPQTKIAPTSITIHNTGNPTSNARGERAWLDNPSNDRVASWHYVVDNKEAIRAIPDNEMAYHAGTLQGNQTSIGIEICEISGSYDYAVKFVAWLLNKYNWGISRLTTHKAWSGKECPRLILPQWNKFVQDVQREMDVLKNVHMVLVNGQRVNMPVKVTGGRTYVQLEGENGLVWVQLRALSNMLGAELSWDEPVAKLIIK